MTERAEEDGVEIKDGPDASVLCYRYGVLHRDDGPAVIRPSADGVEYWFYQFGKVHRDDGPAIIRADGSKEWLRDGKHHREDGPAVESADGSGRWYLNGEEWSDGPSVLARRKAEQAGPDKDDGVEIKHEPDGTVRFYRYGVLNRDDGPAVIWTGRTGVEYWFYQFGKVHRDGGPAIIRPDGSKEWLRDGKHHREDGPAVESADGSGRWYLNGEEWPDGPSVLARQKAERFRALKTRPTPPNP